MHADSAAKMLLGKANLNEAQALRNRLAKNGIEVALIHNEITCTKGCSTQVEIWAHPADVQDIAQMLHEDRSGRVESAGYDPALLDAVYDPSASEAVCPACGTSFAPTSDRCPECDLCFGVPEAQASGGGCGTGKKGCG